MKRMGILFMTILFSLPVVYGQAQNPDKAKSKESQKVVKTKMVQMKKLEGADVSKEAVSNFKYYPGRSFDFIYSESHIESIGRGDQRKVTSLPFYNIRALHRS